MEHFMFCAVDFYLLSSLVKNNFQNYLSNSSSKTISGNSVEQ